MMKTASLLISGLCILLLTSIVTAGPVSIKEMALSFDLPTQYEGYQLHFISVGEFNTDTWDFSQYLKTIEQDYVF
jgi:hypothetical protein